MLTNAHTKCILQRRTVTLWHNNQERYGMDNFAILSVITKSICFHIVCMCMYVCACMYVCM